MSDRDANVLHVIGSDTPLCRLETLRALYAQPELGRQRVVRFGNGRLDCSGLGTVERVRVPFPVDWLAHPSLRDMLPTAGPMIVHILSDVEWPPDLRRLADRLPQLSSNAVMHFVCPSETARRCLRAIGVPSEACALIRDSVDVTAIEAANRADLRRQLEISPRQTAVLILPPVRRETGSLVAAWGAMLLEHARPGVRLLVPDVGREGARVARLVESCGLRAMLRMVEWRFSLPELLAAADLAIYLPTGDAPLWGVAHALAAGRPLVASDVRATRELFTDERTAWLCHTDSPKDACRRMLHALEDRDQSDRRVQAARAQANAAFGRRRMIEQYRRVYENLLADRPVGSGLADVGLVR